MRTLTISAKCSDMFSAILNHDAEDNDGPRQPYDGYVPKWFPNPNIQHWGDYVELEIDIDTGKIVNWKTPTEEDLEEAFKQTA